MEEAKPFVRPWANWTPEDALFAAAALNGENDYLDGRSQEDTRRLLKNLEGYQAEHELEQTLEKNAPLFSAKGLRRESRLLFPKANESIDANRPGYVTALQGVRDVVTMPLRAGINIGGDLQNAGRALLGFKLVDPEEYSMANAKSVVANDPVVALTAHPGAAGTRLLSGVGQAAASTGGKVAGKVGRALGGFLGEGGSLTGMEVAGNLGDVDYQDALLMGMGGTGLARMGAGAVELGGRGAKAGAQYLTRKKWNINPSDSKKSNLLQREFGGEKLPKETELLLLESGELGREPIAAEAVAGKESAWAKRTGAKYEEVAAQQNARLEDALALRPQVGEGAKARSIATRTDGLPASAPSSSGSQQATEFRASLERAGIRPSELIVRDGETAQVALAREMNAREAYIQKAEKQIEKMAYKFDRMEPGAEKDAAGRSLDALQEQVAYIRKNLEKAANLANELDLGIVGLDVYEGGIGKYLDDVLADVAGVTNSSTEEAKAAVSGLVNELKDSARFKRWNRDNLGNPNGSGRFIPSGKLREMVTGATKKQLLNSKNDPVLETAAQNAASGLRRVKNRIDQEQSQGALGETASVESLRHAIYDALWNKQPTVDNANRMTIGNLYGFVQRQPIHDRAMTKLYEFGTALVPRTPEQNVARRALGLEEKAGGELGNLFKNVLTTTGREASHLVEVGEKSPTQQAFAKIDSFVQEVNNLKGASK